MCLVENCLTTLCTMGRYVKSGFLLPNLLALNLALLHSNPIPHWGLPFIIFILVALHRLPIIYLSLAFGRWRTSFVSTNHLGSGVLPHPQSGTSRPQAREPALGHNTHECEDSRFWAIEHDARWRLLEDKLRVAELCCSWSYFWAVICWYFATIFPRDTWRQEDSSTT